MTKYHLTFGASHEIIELFSGFLVFSSSRFSLMSRKQDNRIYDFVHGSTGSMGSNRFNIGLTWFNLFLIFNTSMKALVT